LIQNNSSDSIQFLRGNSVEPPVNIPDSTLVNIGERAQYIINPGSTSAYHLMNEANDFYFPASFTSFEAGVIYSFVFSGGILSLVSEVELILENIANIPVHITAPDAPDSLKVIANPNMLTVSWTAVQGAESYEVYLSETQTPPSTPDKTIFGTTTVFTGLKNKTVYYIWVKSINSQAASEFSSAARGIPWPSNEVPAVPGKPEIIPGINQLTVTWKETGGAASYEVYFYIAPNIPSAAAITTNDLSAVLNGLENNVIYYIWIKAVNSRGKSAQSDMEAGTPQIPTAAPAAPSRPSLTAGNKVLNVSWQAAQLTEFYEVWYGTENNTAQAEKFGSDTKNTAITITGLENETTYYVWIRAKNIVGAGGFSPSASAKPSAFAVLPDAPKTPTVVIGSREITINWQSMEGALSYEVWLGTSNNSASAQKHGADVTDTNVTLYNLVNGTTYYIWIKAKNNIGVSAFSQMASGTPSASAAIPLTPTNAPLVISGSEQLTVSWEAAEGAASYEVWVGTTINPQTAAKYGNDVTGLSSVVTGLTNGTTYFIWIKAKNSIGASEFSPMASEAPSIFTVAPLAPAAPIVTISNAQAVITWTAVAGATSYEVYTATTNNSASAAKYGNDISGSLSVTIGSLTNGTTYYFWLRAKNNSGASGYSPSANAKPIANAGIPILNAANEQLSISWSVIAGADNY